MSRPLVHTVYSIVAASAVIALGMSACSSSSSELSGPSVAVVADQPIYLHEYRRSYVDYLIETGLPDDPMRRESFLRRMINVRLISEEARSAGIENSAAYKRHERLVEAKLLVDAFVEERVYSDIRITERDLEEMFVRANTQITARHLYAPTRERAMGLIERLEEGASFDELATEVFDDPRLAESGGLIGPFGFDEMDPAFEEAAYNLPVGEVSEPVRTATGFSVIRVEDRTAKPILTESEFATRRDRLEAYVAYRKKSKARARYLSSVLHDLSPVFERRTLELLAGVLLPGVSPAGEALDDEAVLVRFEGTVASEWTIADFRNAAELASDAQLDAVRSVQNLTTFVEGLLARDEIAARAKGAGIGQSVKYLTALRHEMDEWIYEKAYGDIVASIEIPADSLQAFYMEYGSEMRTDPKVTIREILVSSAQERDQVERRLDTEPFKEVAARFSIRQSPGSVGGDEAMTLTRDQLGFLADSVFKADAGDVIGPVEIGGLYAWVQVIEHVEQRQMTFEEAAPRIERMMRYSRRQDVLRSKALDLRARIQVRSWPERAHELTLTRQIL